MLFRSLEKYRDFTLVIVRVLLGLTLVFSHGLPKVLAPDRWESTGRAMEAIGIGFAPMFWGFMAAYTELLAGILLLIGLAVRPAAAVMIFVMFVATAQNIANAGSLSGGRAHPVDAAAGYIVVLVMGAGSYSLDRRFGFDSVPVQRAQPVSAGV